MTSLAATPVLLLLAVASLLAGCPGEKGPADGAIAEYLGRGDATAAPLEGDDASPAPPPPATRVALTVVSGKDLPDTDGGPGVTDPYVIVEYAGQRWETSVIEGSQEPTWGDSFVFDVVPGGILTLSLMDEDALTSDHKISGTGQRLNLEVLGRSDEFSLTRSAPEHRGICFIGNQ